MGHQLYVDVILKRWKNTLRCVCVILANTGNAGGAQIRKDRADLPGRADLKPAIF